MKTFDIALKYLKDIDFTGLDIYTWDKVNYSVLADKIVTQQKTYILDKENNVSNDYYRNMVFLTCIYHLADIANRGVSFFDVACEIIESDKSILNSKYEGFTKGSQYPKVMTDKFIKYCDNLNPQPSYLSEKGEVRIELFMTAFHYITEKNS